jgi:hypothetical protein
MGQEGKLYTGQYLYSDNCLFVLLSNNNPLTIYMDLLLRNFFKNS